jgi:hypothetical protein
MLVLQDPRDLRGRLVTRVPTEYKDHKAQLVTKVLPVRKVSMVIPAILVLEV